MESASELLCLLQGRGVDVLIDGSDLVLTPRDRVPGDLLPEIRRRKPELLRLVGLTRIDPNDRDTWPEYLRRLERISLEQFGPDAAEQQVRIELAFLARAERDGWVVLPAGGAA